MKRNKKLINKNMQKTYVHSIIRSKFNILTIIDERYEGLLHPGT